MKKIFLLFVFCCLSRSGFAATWYSQANTAVTVLANWNSLAAGGGATPATFATAGDIWIIQSNMSIAATTWTIGGSLQIMAGGNRLAKTNAAGNSTVNIGGDLSIMGNGRITTGATSSGNFTFNLSGNLSMAGTSFITSTGGAVNFINFTNTASTFAAPQTITWTATGASLLTSINVNANCFVQLLSDVPCPQNGTTGITVNGTLICGTFVMSSASTDAFTVNAGASLYTANAGGIDGSVTLMSSTSFSGAANYIYNGALAQVTGISLPPAMLSGGSVTINNSSTGVTLSQTTSFASGAILNLENGAFTNTAANLVMASGANVNRDNGTLAAAPTTYSGVNLTYNNLGNNALAVTTGNEWPAAFTGNTTVNKTGATITLNGNRANTGPITLTAGTLDASATNYNISLTGTWANNSAATAFTARAGTVTMNGATAQTLGGTFSTTFDNFTLNNAAGVTIGIAENVNGTLTLTSGRITIGTNNLILGTAAPAVAGALSSANMIIASSTGQVRKLMNANGSFLYPVGDAVPNYTPITLNFTAGTYGAGAYAAINLRNVKHPNNANVTDYLNRYWSISTSGITAPAYAVTAATYVPADVVGTEANISTGEYTGALPWVKFGVTNTATHTLTSTGVSNITSAFTGLSTAAPTVSSSAGTSICLGSNTSLSVTSSGGDPTLSFSWAPGASLSGTVGSPVTATPTVTTTYTVTVTDGNGFTSTATTTITVNPVPTAILGVTSVCIGATTSLSDLTGTGTWSSTSASASIGSLSGIVTGNSAGTSTISYNAAGCATTTIVTVNTPPTAITGSSVVCTGTSITLSDAVAGGLWTSTAGSGTANIGSTSGVVNGLSVGTVTISYTTASCNPATYIVTVNVGPNPITGPVAVCTGGTITMSDATLGGAWSSTADASVDPATGVVTGDTSGSATISYTVPGCSATQLITVNPLPPAIAGSPYVCIGYTTTLSDASGSGTWSSSTPAVGTVGSGTGIVSGIASGATYITYTFTSTGCYITQLEHVTTGPPAISGSNTVCFGYTTTLSDVSGSGTWSSSFPGIASVGSGTGVVTGNLLGTATITYTDGTTGCFASLLMTVDPNPSPISGTNVVCQGSTITLSDGTPSGTWSSSAFYNASVGSAGDVTGIIGGGTTTISYTIGTSCFATFTVNVLTAPSVIVGDSTMCVADSSRLFDSVAGGVWHSYASGSLIVLPNGFDTAIAPGIVTVTYSVTGCPAAAHNVTVNPIPASISGTASLCDSTHANLYDLTGGGVWSSHNTSTARIDSFSGVATGVSLGNTTISYTLSTGCYAILPVTVNPLAPPISGTDTICSTGIAWVTDIVGGGTWTSSNPAIASIDPVTGQLTGIMPGITYIVYTLPTGCTADTLVTALPALPAISAPSHMCTGSVVNITDAAAGGVWSSANNYIASVDTSGVLSGHFPGTVDITYTTSAFKGCYATASVVVNPLPVPVITRNITTHTLSTGNYYTSYQWYNNRIGIMPGATTSTLVIPFTNDSFSVTVTDTNGCIGSATWFFYDFTGVNNVVTSNVKIYPNPAVSTLFIECAVPVRAVISTIDGRMVMNQANAKEMNISMLATGMYLVALYDDEGNIIMMQKVTKE